MRWRKQDGIAAVEFALILLFLMPILFGTIEFGITMAKWEDYESAAREGARFAAVHCSPTAPCSPEQVWAAVKNASTDFTARNAEMPTTFEVSPLNCSPWGNEQVVVSWRQTFQMNVLATVYAPVRTMRGVFRCE